MDTYLIAIHGNGGGGFRFERIRPYLPDSIHFEAVTLPGFASIPRDPSLLTMADYAAALDQVSELIHADGRKILLGTGIGGSFALQYLQTGTESVDGLILHAPVGTRLDERWFPRLMKLPGMAGLGQWLFSSRLTRPLFKRLLFIDHTQIPSDYLARFFDEYRHCQVFGQMFGIITRAWWDALKPTQIPAALLWGERERVLSVDQLDDYKVLLPNHVVQTVPGWDHFPMIEQPDEYAAALVDLIKRMEGLKA